MIKPYLFLIFIHWRNHNGFSSSSKNQTNIWFSSSNNQTAFAFLNAQSFYLCPIQSTHIFFLFFYINPYLLSFHTHQCNWFVLIFINPHLLSFLHFIQCSIILSLPNTINPHFLSSLLHQPIFTVFQIHQCNLSSSIHICFLLFTSSNTIEHTFSFLLFYSSNTLYHTFCVLLLSSSYTINQTSPFLVFSLSNTIKQTCFFLFFFSFLHPMQPKTHFAFFSSSNPIAHFSLFSSSNIIKSEKNFKRRQLKAYPSCPKLQFEI